jgi:hypothetical protein
MHTLQGDRPGLQVTAEKTPQARLNFDSVNPEEWGPVTGWTELHRSHHQSKGSVYAYHSLEARAWEPGG